MKRENLKEGEEDSKEEEYSELWDDGFLGRELLYACEKGMTDYVRRLLENNGDVNFVGDYVMTPLHFAARGGHVDVVKMLLEYNADVNPAGGDEKTALHYAAQEGHVDVAKVLIEHGAQVNAVDGGVESWRPLHFAAQQGHVEVVKVLIQNGADVNTVLDRHCWTALHEAACAGYADVVKVLLEKGGADVNAVDTNEDTALRFTAAYREVRCMLTLLCFGAEINEREIDDDTTKLLRPIHDRFTSLREGKGMETTLMSDEERRFMWNLAFFFTIKHRVAAFKAYYAVRSFITYHGIFMGPGYDLGKESVWRKRRKQVFFW